MLFLTSKVLWWCSNAFIPFFIWFVGIGLAPFFLAICSRATHLYLKCLFICPTQFSFSSFIAHEMELGLMLFFIFTLALFLFPTSFYFPLFLACNERWTFPFLEKILWCYGVLLSLAPDGCIRSPFKSAYGFFGVWAFIERKSWRMGIKGEWSSLRQRRVFWSWRIGPSAFGFCSPKRGRVMSYCL